MPARRICIVSSGCLSTGPRVVKEADALSVAGHDVHVVVCHWMPGQAEWDVRLATGKPWSWSALSWKSALGVRRPSLVAGQVLQRVGRGIARVVGPLSPLDEVAFSGVSAALVRHTRGTRADLFIGHNLAALPATAALARRAGVPFAFDAEDDHLGELPESEHGTLEARLRDTLLARYLPRCVYVSTPSEGIADSLQSRYGIARPVAVHNTFAWSSRATLDGVRRDRQHAGLSLYWCSQTVGLARGLQDAIRAAARVKGDIHLHVRGDGVESVRDELRQLAREVGFGTERLHFHPQVHPDELLSRTAEHDVGLALEQPDTLNRRETVANKVFLYLLAGLAVGATDTAGQRRVMHDSPDAGFLYGPGDIAALTRLLQALHDDPVTLARMKTAALAAARDRWSWEREQVRVIEAVERALRTPPPVAV